MQPYQQASQAIRQNEESKAGVLQNAALAYTGGRAISGGYQALNKLMPAVGAFLSNYVPENLAIKGLNKVDPRLGEFVKGALEEGYSFDDVKNFMGEKIQKTEEDEKKNIIQQHSPELHQFVESEIKNGRSPLQAGALAQMEQKGKSGFKNIIEKLVKEHKMPWSSIVEMVFGKQDTPTQQPQNQQAMPDQQRNMEQNPPQHQPNQGQPNAPMERLANSLDALRQLRQSRGR